MAGASDGHPPAQEGGERDEEQYRSQQQHPEQQPSSSRASEDRLPSLSQCDSRDATELTARMRRQYSRASSRRTVPASVNKPTTLLGSWSANIRSFWRRQISITVDHGSARDHLGMSIYTSSFQFLPFIYSSTCQDIYPYQLICISILEHNSIPDVLGGASSSCLEYVLQAHRRVSPFHYVIYGAQATYTYMGCRVSIKIHLRAKYIARCTGFVYYTHTYMIVSINSHDSLLTNLANG